MSAKIKRTTLLLKAETGGYGVDAAPTGAADAMMVYNLVSQPMELDEEARELARPYLGHDGNLVGSAWKTLEFDVEAAGSGAAGTAPKWGLIQRMCAMGETLVALTSATYKPISAAEESVTGYANFDGENNKMLGLRGSWSLHLQARKRPWFHVSATGLYVPIVDAVLPTMDWTGWVKPLPVNNSNTSAFSFLGYAGYMAELNINCGVKTEYDNLVGSERVVVTDRKVTGDVLIERPTVAAKDYYAAIKAGTTGALTVLHGTTGGNKVQIDAATAQPGKPRREARNGVEFLRIPFVLIPTEPEGNDEVILTAK